MNSASVDYTTCSNLEFNPFLKNSREILIKTMETAAAQA